MTARARVVVKCSAGVLIDLPVCALLKLLQYDSPSIPPHLADITIETHTPQGVHVEDWIADEDEDPDL